ncbi:vanadium-dependent haloperoxidase, partial [Actinomadura welshii]
RSLLLGAFGGATAAALAALGHTGTAAAGERDEPVQIDFDLDTGNYIKWFQPGDEDAGESPSSAIFGPMDVTVFLWVNLLVGLAWFDALAPYHETAVGVHSRIRRRPSGESATNRNMNIACIYAQYRMVQNVLPQGVAPIRQLMAALGLDPADDSEDPASPVGIGNLAAKGVFEARRRDGMNFLGYEGGRKYNPRPWADYTGYRPVNTAFEVTDPSRWQPQLHPHNGRRVGGGPGDLGIYVAQHFVTPQIRRVEPHIFKSLHQFRLPPPRHIDHTRRREFRRSVDEVLEASAALTDEQKAIAEVMDNKLWGIGHSGLVIIRKHDQNGELGLHGWAHHILAHLLATFDPLIVAWHFKARYDAARPVTAIQHVYRGRRVTSWGGPGKGTVDDMPAGEWASYLPVGDHPEYPSGSTTICSAAAQVARRLFGDDVLDWRFTFPAGTTLTEPGLVPRSDLELHFPTWTDFAKTCANSRVWGGVHFRKTVEASMSLGEQFGDMAY